MNTGSGQATRLSLTDLHKNNQGVVMLEFVFAVSILMVIFLATATFSFLFADYYGTQKVATEGAREACNTGDIDWARSRAEDAAWLWGLDPGRISIDFYNSSTEVTCSVHYISRPFSRTFPTLLNGAALKQDYHFDASATYMLTDTR